MNTIEQTDVWVGLDVAKASFDAAFVTEGQHYSATRMREVPVKSFARNLEGVKALLAWLDKSGAGHNARACMEATGSYSTDIACLLLQERPSLRPAIANPRHTSAFIKSLGLRNKTDRIEARALAFYGAERRPVPYEPPTPERAQLRELSRYRDTLVSQRVATQNRADEPQTSRLVRTLQDKRLRLITQDIKRVETEMKRIVENSQALRNDLALLTTIYGVGFIVAATVLSELGDLRRFHRARQLTAFAGVSPRIIQSGTSVTRKTHMCKQGNARVRQVLYLAAVTASRGQSDLQRHYLELVQGGKPPRVALGALMRKILVLMRAILITEKSYEPNHNTCAKLHLQLNS